MKYLNFCIWMLGLSVAWCGFMPQELNSGEIAMTIGGGGVGCNVTHIDGNCTAEAGATCITNVMRCENDQPFESKKCTNQTACDSIPGDSCVAQDMEYCL